MKFRPLHWRIVVSSLIGIASGWFCSFLMKRTQFDAGDFIWTLHLAQRWLAGQNPYAEPWQIYPFTAMPFGLPVVHLAPPVASGVFYGVSSALLAFGLMRHGYHRLLIFLAYPYWAALLYVQYAPLITASAFFPLLLPATMAKPQIGIPVFVSRFSMRGMWACLCVLFATLIALPCWPRLWLHEIGKYQHFYALLVLPGPLILLALLRYRDRDAVLLLLNSVMPQRWFFDAFALFLIPQTRREILIAVFFSWCSGLWRWYHPPHSMTEVGRWIVIFTYLPILAILLLRRPSNQQSAPGPSLRSCAIGNSAARQQKGLSNLRF